MNEDRVIRSTKTNQLMQPGYAFDLTQKAFRYSPIYLDDINKTREEIEEESTYTADQLKAIREKKYREIELQQREDIAATSGLTYDKVILGMDISLLILITQVMIGGYNFINAHYTTAFVSLVIAGGATISYEINRIQRFKIRKARNEAFKRAIEEGKVPQPTISKAKEIENKRKDELDQQLLIENYRGRSMTDIFDKLGPTLQEKLSEQKNKEHSIQKTMNTQK